MASSHTRLLFILRSYGAFKRAIRLRGAAFSPGANTAAGGFLMSEGSKHDFLCSRRQCGTWG
jgi:hypothetical protein